ncbi:MAG: hypothetical protein R3F31_19490 [Verrucomicrobiales bacterium]
MSPLPTKVQAGYYSDSDGDGAEEYYPDPWETDPGYSDSGYTDAAGGDNTSPGYFDYGDGPFGSGEQPVPPIGAGSGGWPNGGPDSDGDGLEDDFELTVSGSYLIASDLFYDPTTLVWENYEYWETRVLDPNNVDSDSDGIPDGVEYLTLAPLAEALGGFVSFDPLDPTDGPADYDNDGLSNRLEVMAYGTDPFSWDSDQDGWFDSEEILLQTDPLNPADPGDSETPGSGDSGSGGANGGAVSPLPDSGSGEAAGESPVGGDTPESAATGTVGEAGATSGETAVSGEDPATTSVPRFLLRGGRLFYRTGEFVKSPVYWWYLDQNDNEGFDSGEPSRPSATPLPEGGYEGNPAAEGYRFLPEMSDALAQTWFQDQNGNGKFDPPMEPSVLVIDPRTRGGGGPSGEQWFRNRAGGSERWHDGGPRETVHFTDGLSAVARYPGLATRGEWRRFAEADKEAFQSRAWWGAVEAPPMPADFVGSPQEWNPDAPQVFDIDALATEIRWASQSPVMEDLEKTCLIEHGPLTAQAEPNHQQANVQAVTFFIKKGETVARVAAQGGSAGAGFSLTPTSVILNPPLERGRGYFARFLPIEIKWNPPLEEWKNVSGRENEAGRYTSISIKAPAPLNTIEKLREMGFKLRMFSMANRLSGTPANVDLFNEADFLYNTNGGFVIATFKPDTLERIGILQANERDNINEFSTCDTALPTDTLSNWTDSDNFASNILAYGYHERGRARGEGNGGLPGTKAPSNLTEYSKLEARANNQFLKQGGVDLIRFELTKDGTTVATSETRQIRDQADWFYYSGHGHHNNAKLATLDEEIGPGDVQWDKDMDVAIIAGCSVLDIKDHRAQSFGLAQYAEWLAKGGAWSPGAQWEPTGPKYFLGYCWKAPTDTQGGATIASHFSGLIQSGHSIPDAWKNANDSANGRNACLINLNTSPPTFSYWDETGASPVWKTVSKGASGW